MTDALRPEELRKISAHTEEVKMREVLDAKKKREEQAKELRMTFMTRVVAPEAMSRVNAAVRRAAEAGHQEVQVITFPGSYCNDRGRRINNGEPDWPASLEGFAKHCYEFYESELRQHGYKIQARVLDYPEGMVGEIGLFLLW
jgi:hypothetical protein